VSKLASKVLLELLCIGNGFSLYYFFSLEKFMGPLPGYKWEGGCSVNIQYKDA